MRPQIVDASTAAKWFIPEDGSKDASRLLNHRYTLAAPDLLRAEFANIIWKLTARETLSLDEGSAIIEQFGCVPVDYYSHELLIPSAFQIASATGRTVYDCLYIALAISIDGIVITADKRLVNGLSNTELSKFIQLLGSGR